VLAVFFSLRWWVWLWPQSSNGLGSILVVRVELVGVCVLGPWVIGANMQVKLFVALQLEVAHHFIERCSGRRSSRSEAPATFRTTKTPKPLLLNPYQLPAHGLFSRCAPTLSDCRKPSPFWAWRKNASGDGRILNAPILDGL